ncbi:helix-turn-helix transcriptional regulator [Massilia sp. TS11]|uniref:ArsR/SmtB family transcription factor n=1 Tax=Massilia sp. TS11 TaxID=2908003 RepID=UPI001EDB7416|nr:helix-turn-helix domain-containing protein [Massilia sp. TS11]MCG2584684.1 helix-turn-helix domain-containing protein [Massilia sp. TS11]
MKDGPQITGIAALIGDHARAEALTALMSGMALTATELATHAHVSRQTMSGHLAKLLEAQLLAVEVQGRHRYYRLASHDVAQLLESLMQVAYRTGAVRLRSSPREPALRKARVCYDHLAGETGVAVYEALLARGAFVLGADGMRLSTPGRALMQSWGIDVAALEAQPRVLCRSCLDWSERRSHLAGALGAALLRTLLERDWVRRDKHSRVLHITPPGQRWLAELTDLAARPALAV